MPFPLLDEIIERILVSLDAISIVKCQRVCKAFLDVICSSSRLRYQIELAVSGYVDIPSSDVSIPERLTLLRKKMEYWKTLNWSQRSTFSLKFEGRIGWRICRGITVRFCIPPEPGSSQFEVLNLTGPDPVSIKDALANEEVMDVIQYHPFIFDPGQDLLAMTYSEESGLYLYLARIPDNSPHPLATNPDIFIPDLSGEADLNLLQIHNHLIALLHFDLLRKIVIVDWHAGLVVDTLPTDEFLLSSFRIISDEHYITAALTSSDPTSSMELSIHIRAFGQPRPLAECKLPELYDDFHVENLFCYSADHSTMGSDKFTPYQMPFMSNQSMFFVLHMKLKALRPATRTFTIVVGPDFVRSVIRKPPPSGVLEWNDWGPANTRCFLDLPLTLYGDEFQDENAATKVYHNRFITTTDVLDFNQLDIARDISRGCTTGIVHTPTTIPESSTAEHSTQFGIFTEPVVSTLPFRRVPHRIGEHRLGDLLFSRFMLDEQLLTQDVSNDMDWNIVVYH